MSVDVGGCISVQRRRNGKELRHLVCEDLSADLRVCGRGGGGWGAGVDGLVQVFECECVSLSLNISLSLPVCL